MFSRTSARSIARAVLNSRRILTSNRVLFFSSCHWSRLYAIKIPRITTIISSRYLYQSDFRCSPIFFNILFEVKSILNCSNYLRYFENQSTISRVDVTLLLVFLQPWPSSGNSTYLTGTLFCFSEFTTCSASTTGTLVSLAPWSTINGVLTFPALWIGESFLKRSAWVLGSPYSTVEIAAIHGSVCAKNV